MSSGSRPWSPRPHQYSVPAPNPSLHNPSLYGSVDPPRRTVRRGPICAALTILVAVPLVLINFTSTSLDEEGVKLKVRATSGTRPRVDSKPGTYTGTLWQSEQTVDKKVLGETPFARCDVHSVMSADGKSVVHDWLFMEERDAINVAVVTAEGQFVVFKQKKYAIHGETLSPVGGFINNGESPFDAARREVHEELGLGSRHSLQKLQQQKQQTTEAVQDAKIPFGSSTNPVVLLDEFGMASGKVPSEEPDWVYLGMYRTAANRGGGFLYSYLLKNAVPLVQGGGTTSYVGSGDAEAQTMLLMTQQQVMDAVANAEFKEIKWAATMSLSLLHLQNGLHGTQ